MIPRFTRRASCQGVLFLSTIVTECRLTFRFWARCSMMTRLMTIPTYPERPMNNGSRKCWPFDNQHVSWCTNFTTMTFPFLLFFIGAVNATNSIVLIFVKGIIAIYWEAVVRQVTTSPYGTSTVNEHRTWSYFSSLYRFGISLRVLRCYSSCCRTTTAYCNRLSKSFCCSFSYQVEITIQILIPGGAVDKLKKLMWLRFFM